MDQVIAFFATYKFVFVILHVFAVIFGMGAALVSDVLFNVFIKNKKINPTEDSVLSVLSAIIWVSLLGIVLSGIALFLSAPDIYIVSVKFMVKMTVILFIIINGILFQKIVHPALLKMNFNDVNPHHKYVRVRRLSFALGAVSVVSWLSAFVLGSLKSVPFSYLETIGIYVGVVAIGIIASQIIERQITSRK